VTGPGTDVERGSAPGDGPVRSMTTGSWSEDRLVDRYLDRIGGLAPRAAGEDVLVSLLPDHPRTVLDLGCGDGRLAALVLAARPSVEHVVAVDSSPPMLRHAQERFGDENRVEVRAWDLEHPIDPLGTFDVIVSGFAIHHLGDGRKRALYAEVARALRPGGLFANLEVVASATPELHVEFTRLIGRAADDPEDRLADVESQLAWMREAPMHQVDCLWRWRGFALLAGRGGPERGGPR